MSELENEWLERQDHPLLIDVILDRVFKDLRGKDLKKCRLVCKTWNLLTIPFTKNTFEVKIISQKSLEDFVQVFRSNELGIPYARFQLGYFSGADDRGHGQEFLQLCGDTIKSIRCVNGDDFSVEDLSELLKSTPRLEMFETLGIVGRRSRSRSENESVVNFNLFPEEIKPKLTYLKKLTISCDYAYAEQNTFCPTYLEELITAAENISRLHLSDSILEVLTIIEKLGRESSIQELTISYRNHDYSEYFRLLRKMMEKPNGLKLKRFEYDVCSSNEECDGLFQLISLLNDSLEHLKIKRVGGNVFAQFPKMHRLKKLSVRLTKDFDSRFVNLNEIFPILDEMELVQLERCLEKLNEFFPESEPCPRMTSLELHNVFFKINGFKQVLAVFPNVTKLSLSIEEDGDCILREIWSGMKQLKYLSISGTIESMIGLDSCLTGSQPNAFRKIGDALNHMEKMPQGERRDLILKLRDQYCHHPSIVNLTDLRSLTLNLAVKGDWHRGVRKGVTDLTGYLSFYSMKRLKHLKVYNCEFKRTCCEILVKELELESWSFFKDREIIPSK